MFGPSPCPGHYAGRLATMASADFYLINQRITPEVAMKTIWLLSCSWLRTVDSKRCELDLVYRESGPVFTKRFALHLKQISPDKGMNFHSTTASFTVSTEPRASLSCANLPADSALYDVSVRRLTALLRASFPRCLAATQLLFASNYCTLKNKIQRFTYRGL